MKASETIPPFRWRPSCEAFSRTHRGWLVGVWCRDSAGTVPGACDDTDLVIRRRPAHSLP